MKSHPREQVARWEVVEMRDFDPLVMVFFVAGCMVGLLLLKLLGLH